MYTILLSTLSVLYVNYNRKKNKNDIKLSAEYWNLGNKKLHPRMSWSVKSNYKSYKANPIQKDRACLCTKNWKQ